MLDFNHRPTLSEQISAAIDVALQAERAAQMPRNYLGASRVGASTSSVLARSRIVASSSKAMSK